MNIYVGNLSTKVTNDELQQNFEIFGEVSSAKIITDRYTGISRGFGFVGMPNLEEAQAAIDEFDGKELNGQILKVREARPRGDNQWDGGRRKGRRESW
jgi:RNA recognition motif-containing protein